MKPKAAPTLTYRVFLALLHLECTLRRNLHLSRHDDRTSRARVIESITRRLRACPRYESYLRRVLRSGVKVG